MEENKEKVPFLFKVIVIMIIAGAVFGTLMSIVNFSIIKSMSNNLNEINKSTIGKINEHLTEIDSEINNLKGSIGPGGIIDKYINAYKFLSNNQLDLEKILTFSNDSKNTAYFSIYVTGSSGVWIGIGRNGKYTFQSELRPGLSPQRFYVIGTPQITTSYTITADSSSVIVSGDPSRTYIMTARNGVASMVRMTSSTLKIEDLLNQIGR